MTQPPEAWYADPADPTLLRWWDGRAWTGHTTPMPQTQWTSTYLPAYPTYPTSAVEPHPPISWASYRPAGGLATASIVLVLLVVVSELVLAVVSVPSYNQMNDAMSAGRDGTDVVTPYDIVVFLQVPLQLAAYIVTCLWLWRVRVNAEALNSASPHARGRGWAWGGWICPVVSWWFPYQFVRDVARATGNDRGVGSWWAFFLVWTFLGSFVVRLGVEGTVPVFQAATTVVAIIAGARWVSIVRGIGRDQQARTADR